VASLKGPFRVGGYFKVGSEEAVTTWSTSEEAVTTAWIDNTRYIHAKKTYKALNIIE
jgi:hypothetical protein